MGFQKSSQIACRRFELRAGTGLRLGAAVTQGEGCLGLGVNDGDTQVGIHYFGDEDTVANLGAAILAPPIAAVTRQT